jgi:G:T-mismatch repair DNA endonuclease (very short patch repair protein)
MKTRKPIKPLRIYRKFEDCLRDAAQFDHRIDYERGNPNSYACAGRNRWMDEICKHMTTPKAHNFSWTKDRCAQEAKKYKVKSRFKAKSFSAFRSAKNNGWLDEICAHMISPQVPPGYWNIFENVFRAAQGAVSYSKFVRLGGAYAGARRNGWLELIGLKRTRNKPNSWTLKRIEELVLRYEYQDDFIRENSDAYQAAVKKKYWAGLQKLLKQRKTYWDEEMCGLEAAKYKTREQFHCEAQGAYGYALKYGFLDEICSHMVSQAASFGECAIEEFLLSHDLHYKKQKRFKGMPPKYRFDFYLPKFNLIIEHHGDQHEKLGWGKTKEQKLANLNGVKKRDKVKEKFAQDNKIKLMVVWQREYRGKDAIHLLLNKRLKDQISGLHVKRRNLMELELDLIWRKQTTFEDCEREAKKYSHRSDFKKGSYAIWKFSRGNGWYEKICLHMTRPKSKNLIWTIEAVTNAATSCSSKAEFKKKYPGAYAVARANGWYEKLCTHMTRPRPHNYGVYC